MEISKNKRIFDLSTIILIITNLIIIFLAIYQGWSLITIMWIYWYQSVIIGFFTFLKILCLKKFSTKNFRINKQPVKPTKSTKLFTAFFFLAHYGIFHLGYLFFLTTGVVAFLDLNTLNLVFLIPGILIFFFNHLFSFLYNYKKDSEKVRNIGTVMFLPYLRIIPMHITIVFSIFLIQSINGLVFFLILKTFADVLMHIIEHNIK